MSPRNCQNLIHQKITIVPTCKNKTQQKTQWYTLYLFELVEKKEVDFVQLLKELRGKEDDYLLVVKMEDMINILGVKSISIPPYVLVKLNWYTKELNMFIGPNF